MMKVYQGMYITVNQGHDNACKGYDDSARSGAWLIEVLFTECQLNSMKKAMAGLYDLPWLFCCIKASGHLLAK